MISSTTKKPRGCPLAINQGLDDRSITLACILIIYLENMIRFGFGGKAPSSSPNTYNRFLFQRFNESYSTEQNRMDALAVW